LGKPTAKDNWPAGQPTRPGMPGEQAIRKAVFEPHLPTSNEAPDEEDDDESELDSMVDSEDWIGEDDRASDSIPPSIMSEPEFQRHRMLMQQPPRSTYIPI
jgi:hypothetical protein